MPKTLVNIITEDNPIPAYLFIKEKYEEGDRLMYISAKDTEDDLDALSELFNVPTPFIEEIVLKQDVDELKYEKICQAILGHLNQDTNYCVNLAGGTRYIALAVQQVFEKFNAVFYYVQVEENLIVQSIFNDSIYDNDDLFYPIRHRMTIAEYLKAHGIQHDLSRNYHRPIRPIEECDHFFDLFANQKLRNQDYDTMELLRYNYRNRRCINIKNIETSVDPKNPAVPHLSDFMNLVGFKPNNSDLLYKNEIEYLTGGWFEEYVYYLVEQYIKPQDLAINVNISRQGVRHSNELDVVFTKGNKLFVIECKTGVQTGHLFNEIVYKLCAIREALLGVSCFSYIFSLKRDETNDLKRIADNMDICFIDHHILTTPNELVLSITKMYQQSNDETKI